MKCIEATPDTIKHPYTSIESRIAAGVMGLLAIYGTIVIFCYRKSADRPCSVTFLWIIIDLAIVLYIISQTLVPLADDYG